MKKKSAKDDAMKISDHKVQEAIAVLIKNTRTTSRYLSLVEIDKWLNIAVQGLGSVKEVADRIDLSAKMLRQFTYVSRLSHPVRRLFTSRKIDSVDAAVHLSKLSFAYQLPIAKELAAGAINTADVRAIHDFSKQHPRTPISKVIENIKITRNIKHYVAEFVIRGHTSDVVLLKKLFSDALGEKNMFSLEVNGLIGKITLTASGKKNLARLCRTTGLTRKNVITSIAQGDMLQ